MGRDLFVAVFATAVGFALSGILTNFYRLLVRKPETGFERGTHFAVMVLAGPNVLIENAAAKLKAKACSRCAFWLATAIAAYWSFAIGLFVLNLYVVFKGP